MPLELELLVHAHRERVFDLVDDPDAQRMWRHGLIETVPTSAHRRDAPVGATFTQRVRQAGRVVDWQVEVLAWQRPSLLAVRVAVGPLSLDIHYAFEEAGGETLLRYRAEPTSSGMVARLAGPLVGWASGRALSGQLESLKQLAEAESPDRSESATS